MNKVCMFIERFPPVYSGAAKQALFLADSLRKKGVKIFFLTSQILDDTPTEDVVDGFPVYRVPFSGRGKFKKLRAILKILKLFIENRDRFDILHLHSCRLFMLVIAFLAKFIGKKVIIKLTLVGCDTPDVIRTGKYGRIAYYLFKRVNAIVCMSSAQYNICLNYNLPQKKLFKIPNGVDPKRFYPLKEISEKSVLLKQLNLPEDFRYITFIGAVVRRKNINLLIDTWIEMIRKYENLILLIIGPNGRDKLDRTVIEKEYVDGIYRNIERKHLSKNIIFTGKIDNVQDYLKISDMFVFPSRSEGFGTALIEAMGSALPCIALNIPGVTEDIIDNGENGFIIQKGSVEEFCTRIETLIKDPKLVKFIGRNARKKAVEKFSIAYVAEMYYRLYFSLMSK